MTSVDTTSVAPLDELALLRAVTLGEYEIHGELGRGGMAAVYLAHEIALDRKVAIKVISQNLAGGDDLVERFRREARTAASLSHPNIIPIYAVRDTEGLLYFVMKLVDGRPLDTIVREAAPLPIPTVQAIFSQIGGAVGYAHRRGVVHRDLKPGNILVDDEGWCVVTDFGIAKVAESVGLTTSGMMVGTPSYMSPEQCLGKEVGPASDQYALGVVAYELLTGKLPFPGTSMMSVMYAHVNTPAPAIEELRPDVPPDVAAAVMRMLEKEPGDRFPNLETAVAAMGALTQSQDETTRSQLITLAKSGTRPLVVRHSTPRSPIPLNRTPAPAASGATPAPTTLTPPPVAPKKSQMPLALAIVGGAILIAVALVLRGQRQEAAQVAASTPPAAVEAAAPVAPAAGNALAPAATPASPAAAAPTAPETPKEKAERVKKEKADKAAIDAALKKDPKSIAKPETAAAKPQITAVANVDLEMPEPAPAPAAAGGSPLTGGAALLGQRGAATTPSGPPTDVLKDLERAVSSYAQALAAGDAGAAAAAWPDMPEFRRQQLMQEFGEGLRYTTRWKVTDVKVDGGKATAKLSGTTTDVRNGQLAGSRTVDEQITFAKKGKTWRLKQIAQ